MKLELSTAWDQPYVPTVGQHKRVLLVRARASGGVPPPLSMVILSDLSSALPERRVQAAEACASAARQGLGAGDRVCLHTFDWRTRCELGWSTADRPAGPPELETGLELGLSRARDALVGIGEGARTILIVTDDDPFDGDPGSGVARERALALVGELRRSGVVTSCVDLGGAAGRRTALLAELADRGTGALVSVPHLAQLGQSIQEVTARQRTSVLLDAELFFREDLQARVRGAARVEPDYAELTPFGATVPLGRVGATAWFLLELDLRVPPSGTGVTVPVGTLVLRGHTAEGVSVEVSRMIESRTAAPPTLHRIDEEVDRLRRRREQERIAMARQLEPDLSRRIKATALLADCARDLDGAGADARFVAEQARLAGGQEVTPGELARAVRETREQARWTEAVARIDGRLGG